MAIKGLRRGIQRSVRNNASAFAYSVMITTTFGVVSRVSRAPRVFELFLFATGAAAGFIVLEAAASRFFRDRLHPERSEVVMLGSALALVSVNAAVGTALLVARLTGEWVVWLVAPFAATVVYVLISGLELALARRAEERHPPEREE